MSVESYFAQRMRDLRNLQGVSQKVLADRVTAITGRTIDPTAVTRIEKHVGDMAILRMEKGARTIRLSEAVAIAEALGVPLSEMLPPSADGQHRQILRVPESVVAQLRLVHEVTGSAVRLAEGGQ